MSSDLPFDIRVRLTGRDTLIFVALKGDEDVALERYSLGDGSARKRVARKWTCDARLKNGRMLKQTDIEHALEEAENRARKRLDCDDGGSSHEQPQASALVEIVTKNAELFQDDCGDAYASLEIGEHKEAHALSSRTFRRWLSRQYYQQENRIPNSQAMADALGVCVGQAIFDGSVSSVNVRLAELDGAIYVDLGNSDWRVAKITAEGWSVLDRSPIKFRRPAGILALPNPVHGGDLCELRQFINIETDEDFILVVSWLVGAYCPTGPYPLIVVGGEQGSAKSTLCRVLRRLVDPNQAPVRSAPRNEQDLVIAANNSRLICLDNLSRVPE